MTDCWELRVAAPARRDLHRLTEKAAAAMIEFMTGALVEWPQVVGKRLHNELAGLWVARRGPYRVIYRLDFEKGIVEVIAVDHRSDVYRRR
jgi:mRNA-degrading endonuclease RelE of RelBE toxin-antitoxin system